MPHSSFGEGLQSFNTTAFCSVYVWSYFSLSLLSVHAILLFPQTAWSYFAKCAWSCFLFRLIFTSYSMQWVIPGRTDRQKKKCVCLCVCGGGWGGGCRRNRVGKTPSWWQSKDEYQLVKRTPVILRSGSECYAIAHVHTASPEHHN